MSNSKDEFYVVEFEDGLEVVRCEWVLRDENEKVTAAYFPPACDKTKLTKVLKTVKCPMPEQWGLYTAKYHKSACNVKHYLFKIFIKLCKI